MKRMRILGLALVAVFALAAITAGAASAKPTWKACVKAEPKNTGNYSDKSCSIVVGGTGKYEKISSIGKGKGFKGKGGEASLHNVIPGKGDVKVTCQSFKDKGSVVAPSGVNKVTAEFKKCKSLGAPCKTEGGKKEVITTDSLAGSLGYMDKAHTSAGISLTDEAEPGSGYVAQFECEGLAKVRVHGVVIGVHTPFNVIGKESEDVYSVAEYGVGQPNSLSNPPAFEEGEEPVGVLLTELNGPETGNTWQPPGGLVSGQEGTAVNKGEALGVS